VDEFENGEFVFVAVDTDDKEERGVSAVNNFYFPKFNKGALRLGTSKALADNLPLLIY
jgi:hypothetical protein